MVNVRSDLFPTWKWNEQEEMLHVHRMQRITQGYIQSQQCAYWTPVKSSSNVALFEEKINNTYSIRSVITLPYPLPVVRRSLLQRETLDFKLFMRQMHGSLFLDAASLYQSKERTSEDCFGVKWIALQTPGPLGVSIDLCVMEYAHTIPSPKEKEDDDDNDWFVCLWESTQIPQCGDMYSSHALHRQSKHQCAYIIKPTSSSTCKVEFIASLSTVHEYENVWSSYAVRALWTRVAENLSVLEQVITSERLSSQIVTKQEWIPDENRKACYLCCKSFTLFRRKHHCRVCGEVCCVYCSLYHILILPVFGLIEVRVCKACVAGKTQENNNLRKLSKAGLYRKNTLCSTVASEYHMLSEDPTRSRRKSTY